MRENPPFKHARARACMHARTHTHTLTHSHSFLQNNGWTNFQWNRLICFWDSHRNSVWCVSVQNMLFVKHFIYAETLNSSLFKTSDFEGLRTEWDTESHGRQQNETRMITRTTRAEQSLWGISVPYSQKDKKRADLHSNRCKSFIFDPICFIFSLRQGYWWDLSENVSFMKIYK